LAGEAKTEGIKATTAERRRLRATILDAVVSQRHKRLERKDRSGKEVEKRGDQQVIPILKIFGKKEGKKRSRLFSHQTPPHTIARRGLFTDHIVGIGTRLCPDCQTEPRWRYDASVQPLRVAISLHA
jgi:hypothetical protein